MSRSSNARNEMVRRQEQADLRALLALPEGRRFLMRWRDKLMVDDSTFTGDALSGAYNEGRRAVGTALMAECKEADFSNYVLAMVEQHHSEDKNGRRDDVVGNDDSNDDN